MTRMRFKPAVPRSRDKHFTTEPPILCINNNRISRAKIWRQLNAVKSTGGLGCRPFLGGASVVVDLLFYVPPIVCGGSQLVFILICIVLCRF